MYSLAMIMLLPSQHGYCCDCGYGTGSVHATQQQTGHCMQDLSRMA